MAGPDDLRHHRDVDMDLWLHMYTSEEDAGLHSNLNSPVPLREGPHTPEMGSMMFASRFSFPHLSFLPHLPQLPQLPQATFNYNIHTSAQHGASTATMTSTSEADSSTSSWPEFSLHVLQSPLQLKGDSKLGIYDQDARRLRLARWRQKRLRNFLNLKAVKYKKRQALAQLKPRVGGRFIKVQKTQSPRTNKFKSPHA